MKKTLLFLVAISLSAGLMAQQYKVKEKFRNETARHFFQDLPADQVGLKATALPSVNFSQGQPLGSTTAVSIIDLGQGGNAFGLSGGGRTVVWADNNINAVGFVHRMDNGGTYGNSRLAMDISKDGGASWWNNVQVYDPLGPPPAGATYPLAAGRYPQGGIQNPTGNTLADNAYFHHFSPTLDASNGASWGGYGYGVRKLDTLQTFTQHNFTSGGGFIQNVPDAFTITTAGKAFVADPEVVGGIASDYVDTMLISKGIWNAGTNDFDYVRTLLYLPSDKYVTDTKIAFAPDGQTGYLSVLTHHSFTFEPDSNFYPVLYKTTNGGESWTGPLAVKLWGPSGLPGIKNYLTDSMINLFFLPPIPTRDEISYTTAWEHDLAVDANGNPHVSVVVGISGGEWNIYTTRDYLGMFDIYSTDGGTSWNAMYLDSVKNFAGEFTGTNTITEYNRPQVSRTQDGTKMFFSWLDTESIDATANNEPNIFCKGYNVMTGITTNTANVTKFTLAFAQAFMGTASHYVFSGGGNYFVPFIYQEMNPTATGDPVQYKYVHNFKFTDADFVGINKVNKPDFQVFQNYPNPAGDYTYIEVDLERPRAVTVEIYNLVGQRVLQSGPDDMGAGSHFLKIDCSGLHSGIYYYTVSAGKDKLTRKMSVR